MKGVALLVALSTFGVDYSWRTTDEGQLEYVIQIEPEFIKALADGEEIHSDVPPEAGAMQRICVRIGTAPVKHTAASIQQYKRLLVSAGRYASTNPALPAPDAVPTIVWPAKTLPEQSFNVTYGWQPDQTGQQAYFVQLDPALLQTLSAGDEIYASVDPTAGNVGRFVVLSGTKQLPRVAAKPAATPPSLATGGDNRTRFQPAPVGAGAFDPVATSPPAGPPQFAPLPSTPDNSLYPQRPTRYGDVASDLRPPTVPLAPTTSFAPANNAAFDPPQSSFNPANLPQQPPAAYYPPTPPTAPAYTDNRFGNQLQPPADVYPGQPGYVQRTGAEQPQARTSYAPPTYNPPPPAYSPQQPQAYNPPPPVDNRLASVNREQPAAVLPAPQISTAGTVRTAPVVEDKPWWPLMFTAFALFLSIGGNLYLGWTAAEFHSRYRLAVDRLRSAGRN